MVIAGGVGHFMAVLAIIGLCVAAPLTSNIKLVRKDSNGFGFDYQNDKIRGVNLGGWFLLEAYITPSLFEQNADDGNVPVDEYHYCEKLGKSVCSQRLQTHWENWITEDDLSQIADLGLNMVRIPIGYWAFQTLDSDPYVQGQVEYVDRALKWCRKYGLKAWIDLHGAAGSQNGFDNSGLRDQYGFQQGDNTQVTLDVLGKILKKYGGSDWEDVVIGIELLNEPLGPVLDMDKLKTYSYDGYSSVRDSGLQNVVVHDAFQAMGYWDNDFQTSNDYWNVVIDHHHYQVFSQGELERDIDQHIETACSWGRAATQESHWNVVGEWSAALTDCATWLNGVGRGARYSGDYENCPYIDSCESYLDYGTWSDEYRTNVRKYIEAQLDAYEQGAGWIFWTWKTENAIEWDFSRLTKAGIFPSPVTDRTYQNQCGF